MRASPVLIFFILSQASLAEASLTNSANAEQSSTRAVEGQDLDAVRHYSEGVGREVLKDELGVDLDSLRFRFDPSTFSIENLGAAPSATPGTGGVSGPSIGARSPLSAAKSGTGSGFLLSVDQEGDLLRLGRDIRDIPFGVKVKGDLPLLARLTSMETQIWVPFSWRDEFKAQATLPLRSLGLGLDKGIFRGAGLRSDYTNRLGINQVDAGLGTQWANQLTGSLDLDYDYSQRFGQGLDETTQWLKLRKDF